MMLALTTTEKNIRKRLQLLETQLTSGMKRNVEIIFPPHMFWRIKRFISQQKSCTLTHSYTFRISIFPPFKFIPMSW